MYMKPVHFNFHWKRKNIKFIKNYFKDLLLLLALCSGKNIEVCPQDEVPQNNDSKYQLFQNYYIQQLLPKNWHQQQQQKNNKIENPFKIKEASRTTSKIIYI